MADQFRYRHIGDRPLLLGERLVKPGEEFDYPEPVQSNANFEALSDNAKAHQAQIDTEDAERRKAHLALIGGPVAEDAAPAADASPKKSKKSEPVADAAAAPQEA